VRGCKEDGGRTRVVTSIDHCLFGPDGIEHHPRVVRPLLPARQRLARRSVGGGGPTPIEGDDSRPLAKPSEEVGVGGVVPTQLDADTGARNVEEVDVAVAEDLIGDPILAQGRVARRGNVRHGNPLSGPPRAPGCSDTTASTESLSQRGSRCSEKGVS